MSPQAGLVCKGFGTVGAPEGLHPVVHIHVALVVVLHGEATVAQLTPEPGVVAVLLAHVQRQTPLRLVVRATHCALEPCPWHITGRLRCSTSLPIVVKQG